MQRRNSTPSLPQAALCSTATKRIHRRNSTPALPDAEISFEGTSGKSKLRKSSTSSSLASGILAGPPGNALRRAFKRLGNQFQKTQVVSIDEEDALQQAEMELLNEKAKLQTKRIQKLYKKRSQLCLPVRHDPASTMFCPSDFSGDTYEVGMVRLVYSKIRSLRESKDYVNVYKRNSWKDLVGDLRHSIRVCLKAQGFINLLNGALENKAPSPTWCANPSLEKQRVWADLLTYLQASPSRSRSSLRSHSGRSLSGKLAAMDLENYKAMVMSSALAKDKCDTKGICDTTSSQECAVANSTSTHIPSPTNQPSLKPKAPNTPPPARCSPVLANRAMVLPDCAADSHLTKLSPPV